MKTFRHALQRKKFAITAELSLRNRTTVDEALRQAGSLAEFVDGIQLAENPHAWVQVSPLALSSLFIRNGFDPVPRLICRDRNRIALQSDLLGLRAIGVTSLVLNKGSRIPKDHELRAKPVFDVSCRELVAMANEMNEEDWADGGHEFVIGTSATVFTPGADWNAELLLARASAGARFLQTQPCFNLDLLRRYMHRMVENKITWSYAVIVTLAPLPSADTARWLTENVRGALIPKTVAERLDHATDPEQEGIDICAGLMREISSIPGVSGINLLTLGNPEAVAAAITASGLREERNHHVP